MEQHRYLIDSNAVIDFLGKKLNNSGMTYMKSVLDSAPSVSVITKIEVLGFKSQDEHTLILKEFMNDINLLYLTDEIVDKCIELRRNFKIKLPDAIIAATSLVYNLTLISRNISDFSNIVDLTVVNPHDK